MNLRFIFRIFLCLVMAAVTLEICARVDDWQQYGASPWRSYSPSSLYVRDAIGQWGKPNGQFEKWRLNSLGYRGPELRPDSLRIAVTGASETFGIYESAGREYPRLLESELRSSCPAVDVVNISYPGLLKSSLIHRWPRIQAEVRPAIAIIFPLPVDYISPKPSRPQVDEPGTPIPAPRRVGIAALRITSKAENLFKQSIPLALLQQMRSYQLARQIRSTPNVIERVPQSNLETMRAELEQLVAAIRADGVVPVLVTHVTRFGSEVSAEERLWLSAWRKFYPQLEEDGFLDLERRGNSTIRDIAAQQNVALIDAVQQMPTGEDNFADFVHFTDEGSQRMAAILAKGLGPILTPMAPCSLQE